MTNKKGHMDGPFCMQRKSPHLKDLRDALSISHVAPDFLALYLPDSQFFCTPRGEMPRILAASVAVMICSSGFIFKCPFRPIVQPLPWLFL